MSNVSKWNVLAGNNTDPPPDGAPEHMLRSAVNNCMREMMAAVARWYGDAKPTMTATAVSNAYSLATNSGYLAFTDMPILVFKAPAAANTGALSLNVDGLGAKPFYKATGNIPFASGDVVASQVMMAMYNPAANAGVGAFELVGPRAARDTFPTGTVMIFQMAAPPVGWTGLTNNDMALRMVNVAGAQGGLLGGTTPVSAVFTARTIVTANLPNNDLAGSLLGAVGAGIANGTLVVRNIREQNFTTGNFGNQGSVNSALTGFVGGANAPDMNTISLSNPNVNFTGSHIYLNGNVTQTPMDFAVQYVNVIAATRQ